MDIIRITIVITIAVWSGYQLCQGIEPTFEETVKAWEVQVGGPQIMDGGTYENEMLEYPDQYLSDENNRILTEFSEKMKGIGYNNCLAEESDK